MENRCENMIFDMETLQSTMVSMIADKKLDTKSDIRDLNIKLDTANENIGKITDLVNQIKLDIED